jgi:signal transduction histidine kinase
MSMSSQGSAPQTVLVAGDLEELQPLLARLRWEEEFEVLEATQGAGVLQMARQGLADAVLVDLELPGLGGLQVLQEARASFREIPIILFSSSGDIRQAVEAVKQGAADYLLGPPDPLDAVHALRAALHGGAGRESVTPAESEASETQAQKMETLGRVTSAVAHDLNNQMTVMLGYTEILLGQYGAAGPLGASLQEIHNAADRAAALTRQLLDYSRKEAPTRRPLDLNALVAGMDRMVRRLVGEGIDVSLDLKAQAAYVKAHPVQLEQVIMNLVLNARDAMPNGGRLTLATANVVQEANPVDGSQGKSLRPYVMLIVSDSGCGMDPDTQVRLFEPFFTTKPPGQGTGLGMTIIRKIIEQNEGTIQVTSVLQKGTTFTIYLPPCMETDIGPAPGPPATAPQGSETVLLVEDNEEVRSMLREFLRRHGYTVLEAQGGRDALQVCERYPGPIQLLVTDVGLPHMDGPELARRVSALRPGIKVLFMSGYNAPLIFQHGAPDPGVLFIQKPFTTDLLARMVRELLDRKS